MDRMASIELALMNEQTEMKFYLQEAKRSQNKLARAMFENLAKDEGEHMARIQKLHAKLLQSGAWPRDVVLEVAGTNVREVLTGLANKRDAAMDHTDDDLKALQKAERFETNGARFYGELANACDNPQEKTFFQFLSRIEREHQLSITDTLAYLQDPAAWMMQHERAGFDGA